MNRKFATIFQAIMLSSTCLFFYSFDQDRMKSARYNFNVEQEETNDITFNGSFILDSKHCGDRSKISVSLVGPLGCSRGKHNKTEKYTTTISTHRDNLFKFSIPVADVQFGEYEMTITNHSDSTIKITNLRIEAVQNYPGNTPNFIPFSGKLKAGESIVTGPFEVIENSNSNLEIHWNPH